MKKLIILLAISLTSQIFASDTKSAFAWALARYSRAATGADRSNLSWESESDKVKKEQLEKSALNYVNEMIDAEKELRKVCNIQR